MLNRAHFTDKDCCRTDERHPCRSWLQAGRVWRDGQKKRVYVYRLLATGTIEEKARPPLHDMLTLAMYTAIPCFVSLSSCHEGVQLLYNLLPRLPTNCTVAVVSHSCV